MHKVTKENLLRVSAYIDRVQMHEGIPLFSHLDINPTELCNRRCNFCPRVDPNQYPNQNLNLSLQLAEKIADELSALRYQGVVIFCGFGEPLLHPDLVRIVSCFSEAIRIEIVTNGDQLTPPVIQRFLEAGVDYFVVSMYDGPHQVDYFKNMFADAGYSEKYYVLRDRWHSDEDSFGLKLTNRAGLVSVGNQDPVDVTKPCYYPSYSMALDWNGDVLLCVQDWNKKVKLGNIYAQSLVEVWTSALFRKYGASLAKERRKLTPCNVCNTNGTLHGFNHIKRWREVWSRKNHLQGDVSSDSSLSSGVSSSFRTDRATESVKPYSSARVRRLNAGSR